MTQSTPQFQWAATATINEAREILRLGEVQLEDIREIAVSGDSRAATIGSAMAAVAAALVTAAIAVQALAHPYLGATIALAISATCFTVSAGFACAAASPVDFWVRGYDPAKLLSQPVDELQILKWAAEETSLKIARDRNLANKAASRIMWSYCFSALGIVAPIISLIITSCFS